MSAKVVTPAERPEVQLSRVELDCRAFKGGELFDLPNIIDPIDAPGDLMIAALSDGFESEVAHIAAIVGTIRRFPAFAKLGRFLATLSFTDQMTVVMAWLEASKDAVAVDPKGSSSSTNTGNTTQPS